ncbi:MAG TPA: N-acyl homoserine lactonase family protein [Syntrophomonadaceae bacterium]|nr:N-acyl homoserine lactonase family protein [Syntrophomonadaceae bacterium]HOQ09240.1 N-acyl homoserine lactonase family protein [Syntrophomonadaceae bacterium]HPU49060.1 N-acyl homoserine lactonase family protein [Syntrophomonadaceae bacterium]
MTYTIYPLYNGAFTVRFGDPKVFSDIKKIPSFCFLLIDSDHKPILVDTGFDRNWIPGINSSAERRPEYELEAALLRYGFTPEDIELVIQTHLHWDHTGGMKLFTRARFVVQIRELLYLQQLPWVEECSYCPAHWLPFLDRFVLVNGNATVRPGLRVILTGKHTGGHQAVEVTTAQGSYILGGDAPFNYDYMWKQIPREYWEKYRQGPGQDKFWPAEVRSQLNAFLANQPKANNHTQTHNVDQLPGRLILSHDYRLLETPRIPVA